MGLACFVIWLAVEGRQARPERGPLASSACHWPGRQTRDQQVKGSGCVELGPPGMCQTFGQHDLWDRSPRAIRVRVPAVCGGGSPVAGTGGCRGIAPLMGLLAGAASGCC